MSKFTREQLNEIVETIQGTTSTLQSCINELFGDDYSEDDLTDDDHNFIDNQVFGCTQCGWCCEISESAESESGENICEDCEEENR